MKIDSQEAARAPRVPWRILRTIALALLAGLAWAAGPRVVVTIPPYADLVARVAGPDAAVDVLLPPGATPHAFEPSPRAVALLADADLVVANGGVDAWAFDLAEGAAGEVPLLVATDALARDDAAAEGARAPADGEAPPGAGADGPVAGPARASEGHESDRDDAHGHGAPGDADPHVWLDPLRMAALAPLLADALAAVDPAGAEGYAERAERLVAELEALHEELSAILAPVAGAPFVPFHDAWPHFAERYGLDLVLEIEPFPGREPSARELAEAIEAVRAAGAPAVFTEVQLPDRPARVLAAEAGVEVAVLDPLGGVPERSRYEDLLRYNAERVADALRPE